MASQKDRHGQQLAAHHVQVQLPVAVRPIVDVLLEGVLSAGIGLLLVLEWPSDSVWALGTLFGITLFSSALKLLQKPSGAMI